MSLKSIVLDANILIRSVLGEAVRNIIIQYHEKIDFFVPDVCLMDAVKYIPQIFEKRNMPSKPAMALLEKLKTLFNIVDKEIYMQYSHDAKERMKARDINDWPIVATALTFSCPIWTEDKDFFGSGMPTWTTDRIHIFLQQ
ncbi:Predicted nucleotide-binding protein [Legionella busanensis]|uniref:Predicted nucleotide-binding protein n=1 Tax=Legionella busanensis TaxID=190655 RepID=A0A378KBN7_9GAMM|nr:PIN domain-containing protein [Legionella busanensis]STX81583.1 Predicted nucleotide-binding protein [Legionella busanensis]